MENSTPLAGFEPRSLDYIPSCIGSLRVSDRHSMYLKYVSMHQPPPSPPPPKKKKKKTLPKWQQIWIEDVWWRPFWILRFKKNSVIYSLAYSRNGFSTRNPVKTTKGSAFLKKSIEVFLSMTLVNFLSWLNICSRATEVFFIATDGSLLVTCNWLILAELIDR